jgi:endonuclease/exonuclease/phosphatase family metal-dependent hydrolase
MDPARNLSPPGAKPTPRFPPVVVNRPARRTGSRIRVALLNAAGGRHFRDIAACLKRPPLDGADVILLCEIRSKPGMHESHGGKIVMHLGESLGMSCAYIPEFGLRPPGGELAAYMGNAILSAAPFEDVIPVAMHRPRTPRVLPIRMRRLERIGVPTGLVTTVKFGGKEITVGVAHLHSRCAPAERARQLATYLESFPVAGRAIFGGDLNTTTTELTSRKKILATARQIIANPNRFHAPQAYEPLFDHLRDAALKIDGVNVAHRPTFTFSGLIPRRMRPKLDWLAVRDLRPIAGTAAVVTPRSRFLRWRISDHDFITVDLEL